MFIQVSNFHSVINRTFIKLGMYIKFRNVTQSMVADSVKECHAINDRLLS